jgi:abequosyltransferase
MLDIVIPTYNRSNFLKYLLKDIFSICKELSITIHILDDSTDNKTELYCKDSVLKGFPIKYKRNQPSLGHDKNLISALKCSNADYVWLYGDSIIVDESAIKEIHSLCVNNEHDIISMNAFRPNLDIISGKYDDSEFILKELGWHLTLTGATVYSRNVVDSMDKYDLEKFRNFPQFSLIFHFLAEKSNFYWVNQKILASHPSKKSYWLNDVFSVFLMDWWHAIISLPNTYSFDVKFDAWKNHSLKTNLFTIKILLNMRYNGVYNYTEYLTYRNYLYSHSKLNRFSLFFLSIFPVIFLSFGFTAREYFRKLFQK